MSDVDDAIERADGWFSPNNRLVGDEHWQTGEDRRILAAEVKRQRRTIATLASVIIRGLLDERFEDGTPVLDVALALNPDLAQRLRKAVTGV